MTKQLLASLCGSALLSITLCTPTMAGETLRFQVFLDDEPIGEHSFSIADSGNVKRVTSRAAFDVDVLFINAYRYRHSSSEVFRDGCLQEIDSTTDDNGKRYRVEGATAGNGFRIEHQDGSSQTDGCLMTFAYWDPTFLKQRRLLNSQTGELEAIRVSAKGSDRVEIGNRKVTASRYALSTDELDIEIWYNDQLGWVGLASDAGKGRRLTYRRI